MQAILRGNPWLAALFDRFDALALPDAWIVAGAVVQTVWNHRAGRPPTAGIADIDIAYHDPADLSAATEAAHVARLRDAFPEVPAWLDVKNQARVHLWYPERFGRAIAPHASTAAAIATYPTTASAVGVRIRDGEMEICAPFGLDDLNARIVRPNRAIVSQAVFEAKAARWVAEWADLRIIPWEDPASGG